MYDPFLDGMPYTMDIALTGGHHDDFMQKFKALFEGNLMIPEGFRPHIF